MRPLFPVLLVLALSASAEAAFVSSTYGVSVSAPSGWKQVNAPGVVVAFASPRIVGRFATNVNMTVEAVPGNITLAQYMTAGRATLKRLVTDYKSLGSRATTLGGQPAQEQLFSGKQGEYDLYFSQTVTLRKGQAYVLTGTSLQSQQASLATPMKAFLASFKFTR